MGQLTSFPVLGAIERIRTIIEEDAYLGGLFSFTNGLTKVSVSRVYDEPIDNRAIKGESCSVWFQGEAPYNPQQEKQVPIIYIDIAAQNVKMITAVNNAWKYMRSVIETLNLDANLDGNCQNHYSGDIYPVDVWQNQIWTFILRCRYEIVPQKPTLYS